MFNFIIFLIINSFIKSPIILHFKTYNPLITNDKQEIELIKRVSDEELIKTILLNLIYIKLEIGKTKDEQSQKIDLFIYMDKTDYYFNILDKTYGDTNSFFYPDFRYKDYILLKNILNFTYFNLSLRKTNFEPKYNIEKINVLNETINLNIKNNINEAEEKKEIKLFIPYKDLVQFDHRPGVLGLNLHNYFILNIKNQFPFSLNNWIIYYNDTINEVGELIIGELPHEYNDEIFIKENLRSSKIFLEENMHADWNLKFIKSFIITNKANNFKEYELKEIVISSFRIEEFFILGSYEYFNIIQDLFFYDYLNKGICKKQMHKKNKYGNIHFHILCYLNGKQKKINKFLNDFPLIKFYQKEMNYNFTLDAYDLFTIIPDNNRILFNVEFLENYNGGWVFGKPFFKKYKLVFNEDAKTIFCYVNKENTNKIHKQLMTKNINIIISLLFLIIIIFSFLYYYINKNDKKHYIKNKSFELSEYFQDS